MSFPNKNIVKKIAKVPILEVCFETPNNFLQHMLLSFSKGLSYS